MGIELSWDVAVPAEVRVQALESAGQAALKHAGEQHKQLAVIFVSDGTLAELHQRFLGDDSPTDVMAFDLGEEEQGPAGEVYVSVDCAQRVAPGRSVTLERELALYVVHGCLHLCGFDDHDEDDRAAMREAEQSVLSGLGYPVDAAPHEQ